VTPRDGRWSLAQRIKNDLIYLTVCIFIRAALALPRSWLPALGSALGALAATLMRRARRIAVANLALVNPTWTLTRCRCETSRVFAALGRCLTDTLALLDAREPAERTLTLDAGSSTALDSALAEGRGVVYLTCHLAPWERMAALLSARGYPITTVARESYDARYHALLYDRLREDRGVRVIYRGQESAPLAIVRALRQKRVVGFLMDLPGRIPTTDVLLLGQPARLPLGPSSSAHRRWARASASACSSSA